MSNSNDNNGLYFIVGGLLVAVLVIGGLYMTQPEEGENIIRESTTLVERTTQDESGSSFNLEVDDEGFSASSEESTN